MRKKFIFTTFFCVLMSFVWIYWTYNKPVQLIKVSTFYLHDTLLRPENNTCRNDVFLVIIVTSYVGHVELRSAQRRAMPAELLKSKNATRIFLLARIPPSEKSITQNAVQDESNTFGDLLQGSFIENYRNLTHKHLMGLKWASTVCSNAKFILKVDDDTVFNLNMTYNLLKSYIGDKNLLLGYMLNNTIPRRLKQNKWFVSLGEYNRSEYPPYLSGWYYVTTPNIARELSNAANMHSYFWIDDVFVTGILPEILGIKLTQLPKENWLEYYELLECCIQDMMKKFIICNNVIGPNGGRNNLIFEYNEAIQHCYHSNNCTLRPVNQPLKERCIAYRQRTIFSDGQGEAQLLKLF